MIHSHDGWSSQKFCEQMRLRGADHRPGGGRSGSGSLVGRVQGTAGGGHATDRLTRRAPAGPKGPGLLWKLPVKLNQQRTGLVSWKARSIS